MGEDQPVTVQANRDDCLVRNARGPDGPGLSKSTAIARQTTGQRNVLADDRGQPIDQCTAIDLHPGAE